VKNSTLENCMAKLHLRFWGVRGSIPTPQAENLGHGGNTSCIEVRYGDLPPLIFDAGTGLRKLGASLKEEFPGGPECNLFLTHFHWDHIQGLPFFSPLYEGAQKLAFHSSLPVEELYERLAGLMTSPYFPVEFRALAGAERCRRICPDGFQMDGVRVRPFPLYHPQGATGYRIESREATLVYASDHEHGDPASDERLLRMAEGGDLLIYDSQFTGLEYERHKGWGHSTWNEATLLASRANVKQLVLFHHDPHRTDQSMERIVDEARQVFPATVAAKEGMTFSY
jgi:phosphoribosyl 1,2-cyclic phosphodiesterase